MLLDETRMIRRRGGQGEDSEDRDFEGKVGEHRRDDGNHGRCPPYNGFRDFSELVGGIYLI